ncbi:MAG: HNH endonuclease signature motif containing protein [Planctomycetota bacterium]|nr:HNH endonuclease signature motif containing protein [Planctomycetota bacterium]
MKARIPEVVKMVSYNGIPENSVAFTRKALFYRDKYRCQYCGEFPGVKELTIDHVIPVSRGGRSKLGELRTRVRQAQR